MHTIIQMTPEDIIALVSLAIICTVAGMMLIFGFVAREADHITRNHPLAKDRTWSEPEIGETRVKRRFACPRGSLTNVMRRM